MRAIGPTSRDFYVLDDVTRNETQVWGNSCQGSSRAEIHQQGSGAEAGDAVQAGLVVASFHHGIYDNGCFPVSQGGTRYCSEARQVV